MNRCRAAGPGFDLAAALRFLRGLRRHNDRTWFHAHKAAWDEIRPAWEELVTYLLHAGAAHDPRLAHVDPKRCLFRLANDTRFHAGKAPYKSHLAAWLSPGGKDGAYPGYYVQLAPDRVHVSAGVYVPERPALAALRATFADDGAPARTFDGLVRAAERRGYALETEPLRVMPPGFARAHPRAALIRARMVLVAQDLPVAAAEREGIAPLYLRFVRETAPLVRWLAGRIAT